MKFRPYHFWILLLAFGLSLLSSFLYFSGEPSTEDRILVFVTVGIDQSKLPNENSSYELQRASEHFSDVVLGWTVEPSFQDEFKATTGENYTFTGQRQEKQNLLFQSSEYSFNEGEVPPQAEALINQLNEWIGEYNAKTNAGFVLAMTKSSTSNDVPIDTKVPEAGAVLLLMTLTVVVLITFEYVTTCHRSSSAA